LGEGASWEKPEVKNIVTLSLLGKSDSTVNNKRPAPAELEKDSTVKGTGSQDRIQF